MELNQSFFIALWMTLCFWFVFIVVCFLLRVDSTNNIEPQSKNIHLSFEKKQKLQQFSQNEHSPKKEQIHTEKVLSSEKIETQASEIFSSSAENITTEEENNFDNAYNQLSLVILEINKKINENHFYPERARKRNIEGVVFLKLVISLEGNLVFCEIIQSAGKEILDSSAIKLVKSIFPLDTKPYALSEVSVSVRYELH
ncbi:MAG: energy transducer TonB [Treponemataceae bacterium]